MMNIQSWLESFRENWKSGDVEDVLKLFTDDVEYHETPFLELEGSDLREEWEGVKEQEKISLSFEVFSAQDGNFTVKWDLEYDQDGEHRKLKGVYLIKLNSDNKCYEFWQYFEADN